MEAGTDEATPARVGGVRNNVDSALAEWEAALDEATRFGDAELSREFAEEHGVSRSREIDVTSGGGSRLVQVKNDAPYGVGSAKFPEVMRQARATLRIARQPNMATANGQAPEVVFRFPRGVTLEVATRLRLLGVEVEGPIVPRTNTPPGPFPRRGDEEE